MTRGEMLLHVAKHAAGHRGQMALLLQRNGIQPWPDRMTDFLEAEHPGPRSGARAVPQPEFTGMEWFAEYVERNAADGAEARLVSMYSFSENWTSWERHPVGDEAVICTAGAGTEHRPR